MLAGFKRKGGREGHTPGLKINQFEEYERTMLQNVPGLTMRRKIDSGITVLF